jgi:hypothetical protein
MASAPILAVTVAAAIPIAPQQGISAGPGKTGLARATQPGPAASFRAHWQMLGESVDPETFADTAPEGSAATAASSPEPRSPSSGTAKPSVPSAPGNLVSFLPPARTSAPQRVMPPIPASLQPAKANERQLAQHAAGSLPRPAVRRQILEKPSQSGDIAKQPLPPVTAPAPMSSARAPGIPASIPAQQQPSPPAQAQGPIVRWSAHASEPAPPTPTHFAEQGAVAYAPPPAASGQDSVRAADPPPSQLTRFAEQGVATRVPPPAADARDFAPTADPPVPSRPTQFAQQGAVAYVPPSPADARDSSQAADPPSSQLTRFAEQGIATRVPPSAAAESESAPATDPNRAAPPDAQPESLHGTVASATPPVAHAPSGPAFEPSPVPAIPAGHAAKSDSEPAATQTHTASEPSRGPAPSASARAPEAIAPDPPQHFAGASANELAQPLVASNADAPPSISAHTPMDIPVGSLGAASHTNSANTTVPAAAQTFAALDAQPPAPPATWIHAGATRAEAGYLDPSLGWVAVRADNSGAALHAAIVPSSPEAAEVLSSHLAGLNTYLADHHGAEAQLSISAPETGHSLAGDSGFDPRGQQSGQQPQRDGQPSAAPASTSAPPSVEDVVPGPLSAGVSTAAAPAWYGGHISVIA